MTLELVYTYINCFVLGALIFLPYGREWPKIIQGGPKIMSTSNTMLKNYITNWVTMFKTYFVVINAI